MYFVIEGLDGSGKTTLINYLKEHINVTFITAFDSTQGKKVKEYLLINPNISIEEKGKLISDVFIKTYYESIYNKGIVIVDRWVPSFYCYQHCRRNKENKELFLKSFDYRHSVIPRPDFTIYLNVSKELLVERIRSRSIVDTLDSYFIKNIDYIYDDYYNFIYNYDFSSHYSIVDNHDFSNYEHILETLLNKIQEV